MLARVSGRQLFQKPPKAVADGLLSGLPKCKADPISSLGQEAPAPVSVAAESTSSQPMVPTQIIPVGPQSRAGPRGIAMAGRGAAVAAAAPTASSRAHGQEGRGGVQRGVRVSWELRDEMAEKLAELFRSVDTNGDNVLDDDEKVQKTAH